VCVCVLSFCFPFSSVCTLVTTEFQSGLSSLLQRLHSTIQTLSSTRSSLQMLESRSHEQTIKLEYYRNECSRLESELSYARLNILDVKQGRISAEVEEKYEALLEARRRHHRECSEILHVQEDM